MRASPLGLALTCVAALTAGRFSARSAEAADPAGDPLGAAFLQPADQARPWVYWYWMYAAVSPAGIAADLSAMKAGGIEGGYLMPIKGPLDPPLVNPPVVQLSPQWWDCMGDAFRTADGLGLKFALHDCDGFAVAGGPWITPARSMQKVVWTETQVDGGRRVSLVLPEPEAFRGYYRDIAVCAYPAQPGAGVSTFTVEPRVTTSLGTANADFLPRPAAADPGPYGTYDGAPLLATKSPCWIEYRFERPFTCRSVTVLTIGQATYWANRFDVEVSDDGVTYRTIARLTAPRHGWEDWDAGVTHALPAVTARWFRFAYPMRDGAIGAEDLDSAKWSPDLKLRGLILSSEARLDDYEGKSGIVWRVSPDTTSAQVPAGDCVPLGRVIDLTRRMAQNGRLVWDAPPGRWTLLRMGHTSTGHENVTGGGGRGLECDKFDPAAARFQFEHWFGAVIRRAGPELSGRVLKIFHIDSWECGSQNWSRVFRREFERRRGYDPLPYLPAMAGVPVESPEVSERFLHDVRETIAELVVDNFFKPMAELAHRHGCVFSAESVAPTMVSDGMAHFAAADIPMGEFWLRSPSHDKLNDVLDAVSGARVYGRPIAQSEAFTELQNRWDETPAMLKPLADRNYGFGMNRYVYHVFVENPWLDRRPGMTMNHVGTFQQRDQTWWGDEKAWTDYCARCQSLLQQGRAVADIAVFTGEQVPRRAYVPWRLHATLPDMIPVSPRPIGAGVRIRVPEHWLDPLHGYAYDSINRDALLRLASVRNGRVALPDGASYRLLVVPASDPMDPEANQLTPEVAAKLAAMARAGATILLGEAPTHSPSLQDYPACDRDVAGAAAALWPTAGSAGKGSVGGARECALGLGEVLDGPLLAPDFKPLGIEPDFLAWNPDGSRAAKLSWTHRTGSASAPLAPAGAASSEPWDFYFVANQEDAPRDLVVSLRETGRQPELWDPVTADRSAAAAWAERNGRTELPLHLGAYGSTFIVLEKPAAGAPADVVGEIPPQGREPRTRVPHGSRSMHQAGAHRPPRPPNPDVFPILQALTPPFTFKALGASPAWAVSFNPADGGPAAPVRFDALGSWTERPEPGIRFFSGTARYRRRFEWPGDQPAGQRVWLYLGTVDNLARVSVNGHPCGVAWTAPYRVDITAAVRPGENRLDLDVTNTWFNRLAGDAALPASRRLTWTTNPVPAPGLPLLPAGLLGPVTLRTSAPAVSPAEMRRVYEQVRTPYKYGIVLHPEPGELFDCPSVFRHDGHWYMVFVSMQGGIGYQTQLAESDDLLHWKILGKILPFSGRGWDRWQSDGGAALVDPTWGGGAELQRYDGRYWLTYIGGAKRGYETEPLSIGVAWTRAPGRAEPWERWQGNPVLAPSDRDARPWERATLFKSQVIWDRTETLGHPFVMFYNAKQEGGPWIERIGLAVSDDMRRWHRYGVAPVIDNHRGISGDPQIVRLGDLWVMFYFGAGWGFGGKAFNTFAGSRDLVHWTKWTGPNLMQPSEPWDARFAHKPWFLEHDGVVYQFYCSVNAQGRTIAVATSRDLGHGSTRIYANAPP